MRKILATTLGILVVTLGVPGIAQAQNWIQVHGVIQAVDCQTNALVLNAPDGTHIFPMAANATVFINSAPVGFCTLRQYIGSNATASVTAIGSHMVAARVDVFLAAAPPPPPANYSCCGYYPYYGPPAGIGIGIGVVFVPAFQQRIVFVPAFQQRVVIVPAFQRVVFLPRVQQRIVVIQQFP